MEQNEINVYEILKDVPIGTKLYSPMCGYGELHELIEDSDENAIEVKYGKDARICFYKDGTFLKGGEVMLFPSAIMKDWSKFFKRGEVIESDVDGKHLIGVFESWERDSLYARFCARYVRDDGGEWYNLSCSTSDWHKATWSTAIEYLGRIERKYGGKLNLETLEIEKKPAYNFNTFDKVLVRDEEGEEWQPAIYMRASANSTRPYKAFILEEECAGCYACCIPFEQHGHLAYTSDPEDTLPF